MIKRIVENMHMAVVGFDPETQLRIQDTWREQVRVPLLPNLFCDHVTLEYQPAPRLADALTPLSGLEVDFHVLSVAFDSRGQVMIGTVEPSGTGTRQAQPFEDEEKFEDFMDLRTPVEASHEEHITAFHATIATADGVPPKYSNQLIANSVKDGTLWHGSYREDQPYPRVLELDFQDEFVIATFTGTVGLIWNTRTEQV